MSFTIGGDYVRPEEPKKPLKIFTEKRKGQMVTIVKNYDGDQKELARKLKQHLSCGGTVKNDQIELQGNHLDAVKSYLRNSAKQR